MIKAIITFLLESVRRKSYVIRKTQLYVLVILCFRQNGHVANKLSHNIHFRETDLPFEILFKAARISSNTRNIICAYMQCDIFSNISFAQIGFSLDSKFWNKRRSEQDTNNCYQNSYFENVYSEDQSVLLLYVLAEQTGRLLHIQEARLKILVRRRGIVTEVIHPLTQTNVGLMPQIMLPPISSTFLPINH